ncbi:YxeA family protein [Lacticaseibacillus paracasei]|uniref:YxeA family protein n=1 Tax=Lacticaseibacillus paracasei TaxID=1597 RepID=UPI0021A5725B|nr:YxeA family protein [Lacticaseibacillus paracasei]MCT4386456.1 YxeA family protein [Lacticaseibacillus paracasei]
MSIENKERLWLLSFMAAFLVTVVVGIVITNYQYGGKAYYMTIDNTPTITRVAVPVGITVRGYTYQGTARDAQGQTKKLKFSTNERDTGPFRKNQQVKITVNKNFGVVGYQRVQGQGEPGVGDVYRSLNLTVGKVLPLSALTAITATLLSLLIPLAIFLQKTPDSDAVETATIQIRIINVKVLVYAFTFICLAFLLWGIDSIKIILLLPYSVGVILILSTLVKSVRWITDWSWEPETGFRSIQENKVIKESKLTTNQRKLVWERMLNSDNRIKVNQAGKLVELFDINYRYFDTEGQVWMIETTFRYINEDYSKGGWWNSDFFKYSFEKLLASVQKETEANATNKNVSTTPYEYSQEEIVWIEYLNKTCKLIEENGSQQDLIPEAIKSNMKYVDNNKAKELISNCIFDYYRNSIGSVHQDFGNEWEISYQELIKDEKQNNTQWVLLNTFLNHMRNEMMNDYNINSHRQYANSNDAIFENLFKDADSILFGRLETLFFTLDVDGENGTDYIAYLRQILLKRQAFGYWQRTWDHAGILTEVQKQSAIEASRTKRQLETLKIGKLIYPQLTSKEAYRKYTIKIQNCFDTLIREEKPQEDRASQVLKSKIELLKSTIDRISILQRQIPNS